MKLLRRFLASPSQKALDGVLSSISETALFAAFDVYDHLGDSDIEKENLVKMKKVWKLLKIIELYKGDFSRLSDSEKKEYMEVLPEGYIYYDDLVRVLVEHHNDEAAAGYLYERHPEIHSVIPRQYDNSLQIIEVLIEYIRNYQWHLESFTKLYYPS